VTSELPLNGATSAAHVTTICVSLDRGIVGYAIVSGTLLILAPSKFCSVALVPKKFSLDTLTSTRVSQLYPKVVVKVLIGIRHD